MTPKQPAPLLQWLEDVDARSPIPLYEQIASRLKAAVGGGIVSDGDPLPSVRLLAGDLRINPATVVQAYRLLETDGFAEMRQGAGTFVRSPSSDQRLREREAQARRLVRALLADGARLGIAAKELKAAWDEILKERTR
jgi:GntR family transcriptional regulator